MTGKRWWSAVAVGICASLLVEEARRCTRKPQPHLSESSTPAPASDEQDEDVEFREAALQAWFATSLESTKSIFTLASAGVGLAVTLAFSEAAGTFPASWAPLWFVFATVCFGCASTMCIGVFRANATYLTTLLHSGVEDDAYIRRKEGAHGRVRRYDRASKIAFTLALIFMLFALIAHIWLR